MPAPIRTAGVSLSSLFVLASFPVGLAVRHPGGGATIISDSDAIEHSSRQSILR